MPPKTTIIFRPKRALWTMLLAYLAITVAGTIFSILIATVTHAPTVSHNEMVHSHAYVLSEYYLPLINLIIWTAFAGLYFKRQSRETLTYRQAGKLGLVWLPLAMLVDFVGFVLVKNPISLSPHDFYVGQAPWIYLIYLAVFISPATYVALRRKPNTK